VDKQIDIQVRMGIPFPDYSGAPGGRTALVYYIAITGLLSNFGRHWPTRQNLSDCLPNLTYMLVNRPGDGKYIPARRQLMII
jgi:hypothetical protein